MLVYKNEINLTCGIKIKTCCYSQDRNIKVFVIVVVVCLFFKSSGTTLNITLRVNFQTPLWSKVFLFEKWCGFWLIPTKISSLKEFGDKNRQRLNQPNPTQLDNFSLPTISSIWKQLFRELPNIISNASVYNKQKLAWGW